MTFSDEIARNAFEAYASYLKKSTNKDLPQWEMLSSKDKLAFTKVAKYAYDQCLSDVKSIIERLDKNEII